MKDKRSSGYFILALILTLLSVSSIADANPTLSLDWYKNNGYGMGNDIGGQWTITAVTSSDINRVEFYLDNQLTQNSTQAPFQWAFNTANYTLNNHSIKVIAYNTEGQIATAQDNRNFVEYSMMNTLGLIIGVVIAVIAIALVVAVYRIKNQNRNRQH